MSSCENVASDTNELELFRSGIVTLHEYNRLAESEQETLKLVQKTLFENVARVLAPPNPQVVESPSEDVES